MPFISNKCCGNCQYWDGERKVGAVKDKAEVKMSTVEGICLNKKSANSRGKSRKANHPSNCSNFEKWDQLK